MAEAGRLGAVVSFPCLALGGGGRTTFWAFAEDRTDLEWVAHHLPWQRAAYLVEHFPPRPETEPDAVWVDTTGDGRYDREHRGPGTRQWRDALPSLCETGGPAQWT